MARKKVNSYIGIDGSLADLFSKPIEMSGRRRRSICAGIFSYSYNMGESIHYKEVQLLTN
jgi:hypothetical protein